MTFVWGLRCEKNSTNPSQTPVNTLRLSQNVKKERNVKWKYFKEDLLCVKWKGPVVWDGGNFVYFSGYRILISLDTEQIYFSGSVENVLFRREDKSFYQLRANISLDIEKAMLSLSLERHCLFFPLCLREPLIEKLRWAKALGGKHFLVYKLKLRVQGLNLMAQFMGEIKGADGYDGTKKLLIKGHILSLFGEKPAYQWSHEGTQITDQLVRGLWVVGLWDQLVR